jgi:hypothetical protein
MTPNATVNWMATRLEHQLLEARLARKRMAEEIPPARSPRASLVTTVWRSIRAVGWRRLSIVRDARRQAPEQGAAATVR